jgi:tRNA threonylcarbamoyladenosine biosynthesis protein TsaB
MSLILNIDTSSEKAAIALARQGETIYQLFNEDQKDHAAWIHPAIHSALAVIGEAINELTAVGFVAGPGSYTGLRVGMATAKGLCYALKIPLITINTLEAMTYAALNEEADLYCPLIDARRMEVYTALYDKDLQPILSPSAMILNEGSFQEELKEKRILFFGSGRVKLQSVLSHEHAIFSEIPFEVSSISSVINKKYNLSDFAELTYSEPIYVKDVYVNTLNKL